ncbi:hypothetical protein GCM10010206_33950 [Streptomyces cinerochromogenes]|nr:hypothetical protein GCM10010206_33950 [Streptomyces cinerochromogenes]
MKSFGERNDAASGPGKGAVHWIGVAHRMRVTVRWYGGAGRPAGGGDGDPARAGGRATGDG